MPRPDGRTLDQHRPVEMIPGFQRNAEGSVLYRAGRTVVLCTASIDEGVPTPVLTTALYERFSSRGNAEFQDKLLSAMRYQFGGHLEKQGK